MLVSKGAGIARLLARGAEDQWQGAPVEALQRGSFSLRLGAWLRGKVEVKARIMEAVGGRALSPFGEPSGPHAWLLEGGYGLCKFESPLW